MQPGGAAVSMLPPVIHEWVSRKSFLRSMDGTFMRISYRTHPDFRFDYGKREDSREVWAREKSVEAGEVIREELSAYSCPARKALCVQLSREKSFLLIGLSRRRVFCFRKLVFMMLA